MIRELIKPTDNKYTLNLPDEMIGKTIEVLAFEIDSKNELPEVATLQDIEERYSRYPIISHENYQFDRDEANDYE